jgi:transaldolase
MELYADGADWNGIVEAARDPCISGFTTNPSLMRQAGVREYLPFARGIIEYLKRARPTTTLSLEVFADELGDMVVQARYIQDLAEEYKVFVKIPITNTKGESTESVVRDLAFEGILVNVTAVMAPYQIQSVIDWLKDSDTPSILSVFAGRIADAGIDPTPIMKQASTEIAAQSSKTKLLWASPRQAFDYVLASNSGCDIITMTPALIKKMNDNFSKTLWMFSLETVKMFFDDAAKSEYTIP